MNLTPIKDQFQTPLDVCRYMISLIPDGVKVVLEPTPGNGNLVIALTGHYIIHAPENYFKYDYSGPIDCVVMNPPFTHNEVNFDGAHESVQRLRGAKVGYWFLYEMMRICDNIIALVPWYTLINSKNRTHDLMDFGLVSVTNLPRSTFKGSRIQICVIKLIKGWTGGTEFLQYGSSTLQISGKKTDFEDFRRQIWKFYDDGSIPTLTRIGLGRLHIYNDRRGNRNCKSCKHKIGQTSSYYLCIFLGMLVGIKLIDTNDDFACRYYESKESIDLESLRKKRKKEIHSKINRYMQMGMLGMVGTKEEGGNSEGWTDMDKKGR